MFEWLFVYSINLQSLTEYDSIFYTCINNICNIKRKLKLPFLDGHCVCITLI